MHKSPVLTNPERLAVAFGRDSAAATQRGVKHEDIYHFYVWQSESVLSGMDVLRGENFLFSVS